MNIMASTALRNDYATISSLAKSTGEPIYITKNGEGDLVVMSIDAFSRMNQNVEQALDDADTYAESNTDRLTHEDVFGSLRRRING